MTSASHRQLPLIFLTVLTLFGMHSVSAQTIDAAFYPKKLQVGQQGTFILKITNGIPGKNIPISFDVPGLKIDAGNKSSMQSITSTGRKSEYSFFYAVTALEEGEFSIAPFSVEVNGVSMTTPEAKLSVGQPTAAEAAQNALGERPHFLKLIAEKESIYPNELVPLRLEAYSRSPRRIYNVDNVQLEDDRFVFPRFSLDPEIKLVEVGNYQFNKIVMHGPAYALSSAEPGMMEIGPAEMVVRIHGTNQMLGSRFAVFNERSKEYLISEPIQIELKSFPEAGKPSNFVGTVGSFELAVMPSVKDMTVGDPISIDIEVTGPGNYESLDAPTFRPTDAGQWKTYDARKIVDPAEESDGIRSGRATFTQIIIPQAEVTEIPPFEIVAFNPTTEAYDVLRSSPIPISVAPDPSAVTSAVSPGLSLGNAAMRGNGIEASKPAASFDEILSIKPGAPTWRGAPVALAQQPVFWIAQAVPSIALCTLIGLGVMRKVNGRERRKKKADKLPTFGEMRKKVESTTGTRGDFYRVVSDALDAWERDSRFSVDELEEATRVGYRALESRCHWLLYGASAQDRNEAPTAQETSEARKILDGLPS